jgi:hypothetical protein
MRHGFGNSVVHEQRDTYASPYQRPSRVDYAQAQSTNSFHSPLNNPPIHQTSGRIPRPLSEQDRILPSVEHDDPSIRLHHGQRTGSSVASAPRNDNTPQLPQYQERIVLATPRNQPELRAPPPAFQRREDPVPQDHEQSLDRFLERVALAGPPRAAEPWPMNPPFPREVPQSPTSSQPHWQHRSTMVPAYDRKETIVSTSNPQHPPRVRPAEQTGVYYERRVRDVPLILTESVHNRQYNRQPYRIVAPAGRMRLVSRHPEYNSR